MFRQHILMKMSTKRFSFHTPTFQLTLLGGSIFNLAVELSAKLHSFQFLTKLTFPTANCIPPRNYEESVVDDN